MTRETVIIAPRFNGPPGSGNGGYVCGLLAHAIDGPAQASLRAPPPLGEPLTLTADGAHAALYHGEALIAEASAAPSFTLTAPPAPSIAEAEAAAARYGGHADHRYPTCFVCGVARDDGMNIHTGPVAGRDLVACTWTPGADMADDNGVVRETFIHAALDCPSYWALPRAGAMPALLACLTARVDGPLPRAGETLIVAAWPLRSEGRKHFGASAVHSADGAVIAVAEALWIEPKPV